MAASTYSRIHTHLRNAVPLVWGSLRLAPTISLTKIQMVFLEELLKSSHTNIFLRDYRTAGNIQRCKVSWKCLHTSTPFRRNFWGFIFLRNEYTTLGPHLYQLIPTPHMRTWQLPELKERQSMKQAGATMWLGFVWRPLHSRKYLECRCGQETGLLNRTSRHCWFRLWQY